MHDTLVAELVFLILVLTFQETVQMHRDAASNFLPENWGLFEHVLCQLCTFDRHIIIIILIFIFLIIVLRLLFLKDSRILMNLSSMTINALINVIRNLNLAQLSVVRCIKSLSSGNVVVGSSCSLVINRNDSKFCTVIIFHYSNFVFAAPLGGACSTLTEVEAHINKIVGTFCHR